MPSQSHRVPVNINSWHRHQQRQLLFEGEKTIIYDCLIYVCIYARPACWFTGPLYDLIRQRILQCVGHETLVVPTKHQCPPLSTQSGTPPSLVPQPTCCCRVRWGPCLNALSPQNLVFHQSWEQAISLALLPPLKGSPLNHPPQKQEWPCHHTSAISMSIKFITPTAFFSWPHPSVWWWLGWSKLNPPRRLASTIRLARDPPKHHEKCGHQNRQMKKME